MIRKAAESRDPKIIPALIALMVYLSPVRPRDLKEVGNNLQGYPANHGRKP
jgi:hypothetical protein